MRLLYNLSKLHILWFIFYSCVMKKIRLGEENSHCMLICFSIEFNHYFMIVETSYYSNPKKSLHSFSTYLFLSLLYNVPMIFNCLIPKNSKTLYALVKLNWVNSQMCPPHMRNNTLKCIHAMPVVPGWVSCIYLNGNWTHLDWLGGIDLWPDSVLLLEISGSILHNINLGGLI